jgi:hypothetical protein
MEKVNNSSGNEARELEKSLIRKAALRSRRSERKIPAHRFANDLQLDVGRGSIDAFQPEHPSRGGCTHLPDGRTVPLPLLDPAGSH